jgi:hypothetical protein
MEETMSKTNDSLETTIKYDGKTQPLAAIGLEINKLRESLTEDESLNYDKFYEFCSKLDEGAFIYHFGRPYNGEFVGYHSNERKNNYYLYSKKVNANMIFHSVLSVEDVKRQTYYSKDCRKGRLCADSDITFYFIPQNQIKLIENIHTIILEYRKYEDFVKSLSKRVLDIVYDKRSESMQDDIRILIESYFEKNLPSYCSIKLN